MKWFQDFFKLAAGEAGGKLLTDVLRGGVKDGVGVVAECIRRVAKDNPRSELLQVLLLALKPEEAETLWKYHQEAFKEGRENDFIVNLGHALPKEKDGSLDLERAKKIFSQLTEMDEAKFQQVLELLKHDPFQQIIRHYSQKGRNGVEAALLGIAYIIGIGARCSQERVQRLTWQMRRTNQRLENNWFFQLANRIFR